MVIHNRISEQKLTEEIGSCNNEVLKLLPSKKKEIEEQR